MTTDLLNINFQNIEVKTGAIVFNDFELLKEQAIELAEYIKQVEVNDDNVKLSKKLLATVNNRVKEMEGKRIAIKKEILEPYNTFEEQVKEIVHIVKDADQIVRQQVRELEEKERYEKLAKIESLFAKRIKQYNFGDRFGADQFIRPNHLTKSVTLKSVEIDMVAWLEKIDSDLKAIASLPNSDSVLVEYYDTKDVATAIRIVNEREELIRQENERKELARPLTKIETRELYQQPKTAYIVTITGDEHFEKVKQFMDQNKITYKLGVDL